jgi:hypothetical protein
MSSGCAATNIRAGAEVRPQFAAPGRELEARPGRRRLSRSNFCPWRRPRDFIVSCPVDAAAAGHAKVLLRPQQHEQALALRTDHTRSCRTLPALPSPAAARPRRALALARGVGRGLLSPFCCDDCDDTIEPLAALKHSINTLTRTCRSSRSAVL